MSGMNAMGHTACLVIGGQQIIQFGNYVIGVATFNARAETVEAKPFFRDAFKRTRCLIPVSGYYEWQDTPSGKQPWYFTARDGSPVLTAAGLWDE